MKDHRQNRMVMGQQQSQALFLEVGLLVWTAPGRNPKMLLGHGHPAHGSAMCVLKISDM